MSSRISLSWDATLHCYVSIIAVSLVPDISNKRVAFFIKVRQGPWTSTDLVPLTMKATLSFESMVKLSRDAVSQMSLLGFRLTVTISERIVQRPDKTLLQQTFFLGGLVSFEVPKYVAVNQPKIIFLLFHSARYEFNKTL
jgi:hypothetical protein